MVARDDRLSPGDVLAGRYEIVEAIGEGGMGSVYAVRDTAENGARRALKVMRPHVEGSPDLVERFRREVRASQAIEDVHVARVHDAGVLDGGSPYMVMDLLEGESLSKLVKSRAPFPIPEAVGYALQACVGLAAAHARGVIHRDLKPSNLFLAKDAEGTETLKLIDFGIAKAPTLTGSEAETLTASESMLGSPRYVSPEQLRDAKRVDMRADLWSLGVVLYEMLSGERPFRAGSIAELFAMIVSEPPTPLREQFPEIPVSLERIVHRCLQRSLERRYQDVGQVARALTPFARAEDVPLAERTSQLLADAGLGSTDIPDEEIAGEETTVPTQVDAGTPVEPIAKGEPPSVEPRRRRLPLALAAVASLAAAGVIWSTPGTRDATYAPTTQKPTAETALAASTTAKPGPPKMRTPTTSTEATAAARPAVAPTPRSSSQRPSPPPAPSPKIKAKGPLVTPEDLMGDSGPSGAHGR